MVSVDIASYNAQTIQLLIQQAHSLTKQDDQLYQLFLYQKEKIKELEHKVAKSVLVQANDREKFESKISSLEEKVSALSNQLIDLQTVVNKLQERSDVLVSHHVEFRTITPSFSDALK